MNKVEEARQKSSKELLNKSGVSGTGVGKKVINGIPTNEDAIIVFVQKKHDPNTIIAQGAIKDLIPKEINGFVTDVIEVGEIKLHRGFRTRVRPIKPGYSVSHGNVTAGTIGGLFYDRDGDVVILSNYHVLADDGKGKPGDIIYQPGTADTTDNIQYTGWSEPYDQHPYIGTLKKFNPLSTMGKHNHDSAIAVIHPELVKRGYIDAVYPQLGKPLTGFTNAAVNETVYKCGRTTGFTTGRIIAHNAEFQISYGFGPCNLNEITVTTAMSQGGDSGSIGLNKNMEAFGLLFAGSDKVTLYNPISRVTDYYGLKPLTTTTPPSPTPISTNTPWMQRAWNKATMDGSIEFQNTEVIFTENANQHCYIETSGENIRSIKATVNTGTDCGATWGIGVALIFTNGSIRLNLRSNGKYGSYHNSTENISLGSVKPNTNYKIEFERNATHWIGVIENNLNQRVRILEMPIQIIGKWATYLRVGKMGDNNGPRDHAQSGPDAGEIGSCKLLNLILS